MKRLLRIFALLMAASMLVWLAGCGGDDDDDDDVPAKVVSATAGGAALAGASVPANSSIVITLDKAVTEGEVTVSCGTGNTVASGATLTWTPTADMTAGACQVTAVTAAGEAVEGFTAISFTVIAPDPNPPTAGDCDPGDGEDGVDPGDYPESISVGAEDDVGVVEMKVLGTDPEFDFTEEFEAGKKATLILKFMKYTMANETEYTIRYKAVDGAGNEAELECTFTTMGKEE
jgi:hypothetical protein